MKDVELTALTAVVVADQLEMDWANADRQRRGEAMAYVDNNTESLKTLREELIRRSVLTGA